MTEHDQHDTVAEVAAKASTAEVATFASLVAKPRRTLSFTLTTVGEDGEDQQLRIKFRAIPPKEYDTLLSEHPPTAKEKREGASFNVDTFAPALIAAVSHEPKLSVDQAREIYASPDWSAGEISSLFFNAQRVCNSGLDVPFNARD